MFYLPDKFNYLPLSQQQVGFGESDIFSFLFVFLGGGVNLIGKRKSEEFCLLTIYPLTTLLQFVLIKEETVNLNNRYLRDARMDLNCTRLTPKYGHLLAS